jgi:multiple sugar transport system ATP-binding protein
MIYVTHDQVEAMTLGDRIAVLSAGYLQQVATPMTLYQRPGNLFVAGFIGSPPMNRLRGEVGGAPPAFKFGGGVIPMAAAAPVGRERVLGVRPESVRLVGPESGLPARVTLVEPLGADALVYLDLGGQDVVARLEGVPLPAVGEAVGVRFDPDSVLWFDGVTGELLGA